MPIDVGRLALNIRSVTKNKDGIYVVQAKGVSEGIIPEGWTRPVAEYLVGKPLKWRHERDKTLGDWAFAAFGEVHRTAVPKDGDIDVEFHLFGSSSVGESLIDEVAENLDKGNPLGLSITIEKHSRQGKLTLVYPTELTLTPIPECYSCRTVRFNEAKTMPDPDQSDKTAALAVSIQDRLSKTEAELQKAYEDLEKASNEAGKFKAAAGEALDKLEKLSKEHEKMIARTDELTKSLAEAQGQLSKLNRSPKIEKLKQMGDDEMLIQAMHENPEYWTDKKLDERIEKKKKESVSEFETSPAVPVQTNNNNVRADQVVKFLAENASPELLKLMEARLKQTNGGQPPVLTR